MNIFHTLMERYEKQPILRALVQLVPFVIGSAVDSGLATHINNIRAERLRYLFDRLESGDIQLTEEEIKNEDFLHAFFATTQAALNTRRREKIELLGRLFLFYAKSRCFSEIDEYEELLSILDDLEYREFKILLILHKFEEANPIQSSQNALQRSSVFWKDFKDEVQDQVGIQLENINGYLSRINRTGLYQTFIGGFMGYSGNQGHLTPLFYRLIERLN